MVSGLNAPTYVITNDGWFIELLGRWVLYLGTALGILAAIGTGIEADERLFSIALIILMIVLAMVGGLRIHASRLRKRRIHLLVRFAILENLPLLAERRARYLETDAYGHIKDDRWRPYIKGFLEEHVAPRLNKRERNHLGRKLTATTEYVETCLLNVVNGRAMETA